MKTNYLLLLLSIFFLSSCEGEKIDFNLFKRSIKVNAHIAGAKTRATNDAWSQGDAIGIYMINAGEALSTTSIQAKNAKYITEGDGIFNPEKVSEDVKYPLDGSAVDFISYYPHGSISTAFEYSLDVTNQTDQAAIDLLYSNKAKGLKNGDAVSLSFTHQLSKLIVNLTTIDGTDLSDVTITLKGANTKGKFSLVDGTQTASTKGNIKMKVSDDLKTAEAIVLPTTTLAGVTLEVTNGLYAYVYDLSTSSNVTQFDSGYKYTYNITLDTRSPVSATATIDNWSDGPSETVTVVKEYEIYQPVGDGTLENPYTIEDAKNIQPVNGVWVKGFIVGYYTGTSVGTLSYDLSDPDVVKNTALALAANSSETIGANTFPIQLPSGEVRDTLNLKTHPENLRKEVKVKGNIGPYYSAQGMPSVSAYEFVAP